MNYTLVAEGTDINELASYDSGLKAGDGQVLAYVDPAPSAEIIEQFQQNLLDNGLLLREPVTYDPSLGALVINFTKPEVSANTQGVAVFEGASTLSLIGGGLGVLAGVGIFIFGWQVLSSMGSGPSVLWILIIVAAFIMFIRSQEGKELKEKGYAATESIGKAAMRKWEAGDFSRRKSTPVHREEASQYRSTGGGTGEVRGYLGEGSTGTFEER